MKFLVACCLAFVALFGIVDFRAARAQESGIQDVSLVSLLARGADYHGKLVRVVGFCRLEFEGDALYLHEEDFRHGVGKNSVALFLGNSPIPEKWQELSDGYVIVEAVFDAEQTGHFGGRSGTLKAIRRMEQQLSRTEIEGLLRQGEAQP